MRWIPVLLLLGWIASCGGKPRPADDPQRANEATPDPFALDEAEQRRQLRQDYETARTQRRLSPEVIDEQLTGIQNQAGPLSYAITEVLSYKPPKAASFVTVQPLGDPERRALLSRLSPAPTTPEVKATALREGTPPPARPGTTIQSQFPPDVPRASPVSAANEPLRVLRVQPEGDVKLAGHLSVTFSQPMVALSSVNEAHRDALPVRLVPQPAGKWRWAGTRSLLFEAKERLPMATHYEVSIAAGTRSALGNALAAPSLTKFSTPPPEVVSAGPKSDAEGLTPPIYIEFNQRIDPQRMLGFVRARMRGAAIDLRRLSDAEVQATPWATQWQRAAGSAIVVTPRRPLPPASRVEVNVLQGAPSAEGPRTMGAPHAFSFKTYDAFSYLKSSCNRRQGQCAPGTPLVLEFSNPVDVEALGQAVSVVPKPDNMRLYTSGSRLFVQGLTQPSTSYRVQVGLQLRDRFGQRLSKGVSQSFRIGPASPRLSSASQRPMVVLDPNGRSVFSVYSTRYSQLRTKIWKVTPADWHTYTRYLKDARNEPIRSSVPGELVLEKTVRVQGDLDRSNETLIQLAPALENGLGHAIVEVMPPEGSVPKEPWLRRQHRVLQWVQATQLGVDALKGSKKLLGWVTRLATGEPVAGADLRFLPFATRRKADKDGMASFTLPRQGASGGAGLMATVGSDVAFVPESYWAASSSSWHHSVQADTHRWFVVDDRNLYQPGETVHIKGWVRRVTHGPDGDLAALQGDGEPVGYVLSDARGREIAQGTAPLSAFGSFTLSVDLPDTINTGHARLLLQSRGLGSTSHSVQVQEFRRPEFEVTAEANAAPHFAGEYATLTAKAAYFTGAPLVTAPAKWTISTEETNYNPPNQQAYQFGKWTPWWRHWHGPFHPSKQSAPRRFEGMTDAMGRHQLRLDLLKLEPAFPVRLLAHVGVQDVNRQSWSASSQLLVHPSEAYVGVKALRSFVSAKQPIEVRALRVDIEGAPLAGEKITVRAVRRFDEREVGRCEKQATERPISCSFLPTASGPYLITAQTTDARGRLNQSEVEVWVAGRQTTPNIASLERQQVRLMPDKKVYEAGDTAEVLVIPPFTPAEVLVTIDREGIAQTRRLRIDSGSASVQLPVKEHYLPGVTIAAEAVGADPRVDESGKPKHGVQQQPAFASGTTRLRVTSQQRELRVDLKPSRRVAEPGSKVSVTARVRDAEGAPAAQAELLIFAVDEAVLGMAGYQLRNPMEAFYSVFGQGTSRYRLREALLLDTDPASQAATGDLQEAEAASESAPLPKMAAMRSRKAASADGSAGPADQTTIAARENFSALAVFEATARTNADGIATLDVQLPDSLTRYRLMAIAAEPAKRFGHAESTITVKKALMVRPSPPRFLNYGDSVELPVVLQNQTARPLRASVALRADNAKIAPKDAGLKLMVPARDRVEVRFRVATSRAGAAHFQTVAVAGRFSDAANFRLPVWTPSTTESTAAYGSLSGATGQAMTVQPLKVPQDAMADSGALTITTSSTQLHALTDALLYLVRYPYQGAEQRASRLLSVVALHDVLQAFEVSELQKASEVKEFVNRDIKELVGLQTADGGWGLWRQQQEAWPFASAHVLHALARAKAKGYAVPAPVLQRATRYLSGLERRLSKENKGVRAAVLAYALYVRALLGDPAPNEAKALVRTAGGVQNLPLEAVGWLYPVLEAGGGRELEALRRHVMNRATETASTAHFATSFQAGAHLIFHSSRRVDALLLEQLVQHDPQNPLIEKLVRGLLAQRKRGRWKSTQESAWVLLALESYFRAFEGVTPNFVARAWLGRNFAGENRFKGRTSTRHHVVVPMSELQKGPPNKEVVLQKDGPGRLYYRFGLNYAPKSLRLEPTDQGFGVERLYEAVDSPADVQRLADGSWKIRAGALVRTRISMLATSRRYHVALVDPLPAGLEPVNPSLPMTGQVPEDQPPFGFRYFRRWFDHQNLRDERAEAFTSLLWSGQHEYSYVSRATTLGRFIVPPAKAHEMYAPETFGRTASDVVVVQ